LCEIPGVGLIGCEDFRDSPDFSCGLSGREQEEQIPELSLGVSQKLSGTETAEEEKQPEWVDIALLRFRVLEFKFVGCCEHLMMCGRFLGHLDICVVD
jgi:hypothetical protein